jgi:hypothetical protein
VRPRPTTLVQILIVSSRKLANGHRLAELGARHHSVGSFFDWRLKLKAA